MRKIAIIGSGWLGKPLAEQLKNQEFEVNCSTTTPLKAEELSQKDIPSFVISNVDWNDSSVASLLHNAEIAIITIPPGRSNIIQGARYLDKIQPFVAQIINQKVKRVFFTSSTTVYISLDGLVDETVSIAPHSEMDKQIIEVENYLLNQSDFQTTILRLGGLIGEERHPVKFLAQRDEIKDANEPVNMIHQKDIIRFVSKLVNLNEDSNEIYNIVAPILDNKRTFYSKEAAKLGLQLPPFVDNPNPKNRRVDGSKITKKTSLNYDYLFK